MRSQAFVMVVNGNSQNLFSLGLANDIFIQCFTDLGRCWQSRQKVWGCSSFTLTSFFVNNVITKRYAFIAYVYRRPRNEFTNFVLAFTTKGTVKYLVSPTIAALVITHKTKPLQLYIDY